MQSNAAVTVSNVVAHAQTTSMTHITPCCRHAATALDMAIEAPEGTFTEMGLDLDEEGNIIDPVRVPWSTGGMFTTPPGALRSFWVVL